MPNVWRQCRVLCELRGYSFGNGGSGFEYSVTACPPRGNDKHTVLQEACQKESLEYFGGGYGTMFAEP